jgi:hypothetical protein
MSDETNNVATSIRQSIAQLTVGFIRDVGFPIAAAAWLLYQIPLLQHSVEDLSRIANSVVSTLQQQQDSLRFIQDQQRVTLDEIRRGRRDDRQ